MLLTEREREERKGRRNSEIGKRNISPLLELQLISVYHRALISPHLIKGNGRDVARKVQMSGLGSPKKNKKKCRAGWQENQIRVDVPSIV